MADITMPRLSESMTTGRLLRWLVQPGDPVREGDVVAEVETDKANMEIECLTTGHIDQVLARPGEDLPVGATLATVRPGTVPNAPQAPNTDLSNTDDGMDATPLARKRAAELGLSLSKIPGTGPNGRILTEDVEAAAAKIPTPAIGPATTSPTYRFPGGFALRARIPSIQLVQALAHIEKATAQPGHKPTREHTAAVALVHAALQAFVGATRKHGRLDRGVPGLALTLITPAGLEFFEVPTDQAGMLDRLAHAMLPANRNSPRKPGTLEATVAIGCGLESIEPLNPGDIHLSVSIAQPLSEAQSDIAIGLITEGDSRLPFAVEFLNEYTALLRQPLLLLSTGVK
jgi:hypothetical protein